MTGAPELSKSIYFAHAAPCNLNDTLMHSEKSISSSGVFGIPIIGISKSTGTSVDTQTEFGVGFKFTSKFRIKVRQFFCVKFYLAKLVKLFSRYPTFSVAIARPVLPKPFSSAGRMIPPFERSVEWLNGHGIRCSPQERSIQDFASCGPEVCNIRRNRGRLRKGSGNNDRQDPGGQYREGIYAR